MFCPVHYKIGFRSIIFTSILVFLIVPLVIDGIESGSEEALIISVPFGLAYFFYGIISYSNKTNPQYSTYDYNDIMYEDLDIEEEISEKFTLCCYQTAFSGRSYCNCGRAISQDQIEYIKNSFSEQEF